MKRGLTVLMVFAVTSLWGCASSAPPPRPTTARPFDQVRQIAIVASGESSFSIVQNSLEPGRTFDEILKWNPYYAAMLRPFATLVHWGISWWVETDQAAAAAPHVQGVSPRSVVAEAFARTLRATGRFENVSTLDREPVGEERRRTDAIVRLTVPAWGLVRVRGGEPDLLSGFADVHAQMTLGGTGVVVWDNTEDVTHPERLPLDSFKRDREFTRQELLEVLELAGQRLANEFLYARSAGR
jgi:hypothetical protein